VFSYNVSQVGAEFFMVLFSLKNADFMLNWQSEETWGGVQLVGLSSPCRLFLMAAFNIRTLAYLSDPGSDLPVSYKEMETRLQPRIFANSACDFP
jgi:hypothetical protein